MKGFLKGSLKGVVFIAGLMVLIMLSSMILIPRNNREEDWKHDVQANGILAEPENTIDVLFLGDSEVYSSVNPMRIWENYGYTAYCCSSSKQRLWYTIEFFFTALKTQQPKIVVIETNNIFKFFPAEETMMHALDLFIPAVKYHDRWKNFKFEDLTKPVNNTHIENRKGYRLYKEAAAADVDGYMDENKDSAYISLTNLTYINIIADTCRQNGAKLVFLSTPSTKNWNMKKHNRMVKLSEELGADYIDMNLLIGELGIDWNKDTRDMGDHMNYFGAEKVSAYLGKYLSGTGILTSHKGDPKYAGWDKALKIFNDDANKWLKTLTSFEDA
ncbi:MAG: hypothetical protein IJU51_05350 [Clostridia bacterium]|nr:hypothetical protein [Clostridia bacterium]